jgi:hypothetical protein
MQAATSEAVAWVARRETSQREYDETYLAAAVAGAMLLSVTAAGAAIRKHESSFAERPAVRGPIVSDCTIVGRYHDTAYCFGNSYGGHVTRISRANLGRSGVY